MSKGAIALVAVLGVGAGFCGGRWSAPAPDATGADLEPSGTAATPSSAAPAASPPLAAELAGRGDPVGDAFREAVKRMPPVKVATGPGVLTGTIRSAAGEPIAGVTLLVSPQSGGPKPLPPARGLEEPDPVETLRWSAEWHAWSSASRRTATSGSDGTYRVSELPEVDLSLRAVREGWKFTTTSMPRGRVKPGAVVDFTGSPSTRLTFDVRMPNGSAAPSASVDLRNGSWSWGTGWSPETSPSEVPPGVYKATARCDEGDLLASLPVDVTVEEGKAATLRLDLKERPGIRVRLRWPEGERFERPSVRYADLAADEKPNPQALEGRNPRGRSNTSRYQGDDTVVLTDLEPGRFLVGVVRYDGGPVAASATVEVGGGIAEVELVVPPLDRAEYVLLRVLDPEGHPVTNPNVTTSARSGTGSSSGGGTVLKRADGSHWIIPQRAGVPLGADARFWVSVASQSYGTRTVEYQRTSAPEATVRFEAPGRVEVTCEGGGGSPPARRLQVGIQPADEGRKGFSSEKLSREGVATIEPLQPGEYVVVLSALMGEGGWGAPGLLRVPITVRSGTQKISLTLPTLHSVTFRSPSGMLTLTRDDEPSWHQMVEVGSEGTVVVDALPPGSYHARSGPRNTAFTVPGAGEVDTR